MPHLKTPGHQKQQQGDGCVANFPTRSVSHTAGSARSTPSRAKLGVVAETQQRRQTGATHSVRPSRPSRIPKYLVFTGASGCGNPKIQQ